MKINITCDSCKITLSVDRTPEIPEHVISMGCNWCPKCEDTADDYYNEWYNEDDGSSSDSEPPYDPKQLVMPFIIDDIPEKAKAEQRLLSNIFKSHGIDTTGLTLHNK